MIRRVEDDRCESTPEVESSIVLGLQQAAQALPAIDRLVAAWMGGALASLNIGIHAGETVSPLSLISQGLIAPQHERLLTRICEILQEEGRFGLHERNGGTTSRSWRVIRPLTNVDAEIDRVFREVVASYPSVTLELELARRSGLALPRVLTGELAALEILFPDGSTSDLERLYRDSATSRCCNRLVAQTAKSVVTLLRETSGLGREFRVLEIGAGTGGTTSFVLSAISDWIDGYVFTDASPLLIADSFSRFGDALSYEVLDIESTPSAQGFDEHSYDLVIAANVLHATADLQQSLGHARSLLREGGFLIALEGVRRERLLDLIFGLTEGWWRFRDTELRPDYPLIQERTWLSLLRSCGFADPSAVPYSAGTQSAGDSQVVLLAAAGNVESQCMSEARADMNRASKMAASADLQRWIDAFQNSTLDNRRDAVEGYLRTSVATVLGLEPEELDLDQPVSNLGMDSLMAIQLKNRLDKDLDVSIPMVAFLQGKTVEQLIDVALQQDQPEGDASTDQPIGDQLPEVASTQSSAPKITREASVAPIADDSVADFASRHAPGSTVQTDATISSGEQRVLGPMSTGQLALWMIHQRAPSGPAYNFAFAARSTRSIDLVALTKACQTLVKRHPVLRTCYRLEGNRAVRVLSDFIEVSIGERDCHDWKESQIVDWIRDEADRPFDLQHGPVIRFSLLRCRSGDVLSIAMHHVAADLWSMDVLIQELIDLYAMIIGGGSIELGPLPTTYDAYVEWERELDESDEGSRLWEFWQQKLQGAPHLLALPTTYPRPPEQSFQGDSLEWTVPTEVVEGLREVAHAERATMFTIVLAVYQVFLSRICNQDDLLVGTVSASRGRSEWEGIVGYFLNQLVLRTRIVGTPSYRDVLRDTQREVLDALEHQAFPFAKLVEKIRPPRDASRSPLVQTMFIWDKPRHLKESHFAPGKSSDRLRLKPLLMEQRGAPFDLTLIVFELEEELKLTFRYNTDLFSAEAIATLAESLQTLIEAIAADPDTPVRSTPLAPPGQEGLIALWNATDTEFDPLQSGPACFRRWVIETPDAIAIESADASLTYRQAEERAARIAAELRRHGVAQGDVVGLMIPRGIDAVLGILGIWMAGAAYVPLDPEHPIARLQSICDDAAPRIVLAARETSSVSSLALTCAVLDVSECQRVAAASESIEEAMIEEAMIDGAMIEEAMIDGAMHIDADSPAYIIYTSGSTGRPKGVVIAHRGVANLAVAQQQTFRIVPSDRCLQFASLSFDASVFEIMMAFHAGATLHVIDSTLIRTTTSEIAKHIRDAGATVATLPPSVLAALPADDLPDLRILISAGEACSAALVEKWCRGREMFNAYGPTETTVWATTERCRPGGGDPLLGRPIANVRAHVVDAALETTPLGVPGELCLSGPGLALQYRRLPVATSDAFVPNPFDDRFDATMYRTGDRARWTHDGKLEFLGRIDDQLKIDGHRIEPGEIASVMRQLDGVEHALVTAVGDEPDVQLVGYFTSRSGTDPLITADAELRRQLLASLPCYMVPKQFVRMEAFPLTLNGKVDLARLPRPKTAEAGGEGESIAPSTATEASLVEIWREVLHADRIGVHDNFFDLGGASLQALQAADLSARKGFPVSAETMFQYQTIAELASMIETRENQSAPSPDASAIPPSSAMPTSLPTQRPSTQRPSMQQASTQQASVPSERGALRMVVESLGTYLPPREESTQQVVASCRKPLDFPLQRMTGIESRHVAGETEFSIDLARKAALDCLGNSRFKADQLDLLIACNISRYDGPNFQISYEPSTASKLKQQIGACNALAYDVCNACAGFFTALSIVEAELLSGRVRRAMVVSGEYITHLTKTAQLELDGFLDPRLACLTLGDAGAAVIVELSDDGSGFETLDLYTAGSHHDLCVAKATDRSHGGAIMLTDAIKASAVTLDHSVSHAHRVLETHRWSPRDVQHLIMHQTSSTTLEGAVEELNRFFGERVCDQTNTINNLATRGNTASTTHWIAVMDAIRSGRIRTGDKAVFAISGSGQTIGTGLYQFDRLPERLIDHAGSDLPERSCGRDIEVKPIAKYGVKIVATTVSDPDRGDGGDTFDRSGQASLRVVEAAGHAASTCLTRAGWSLEEVELLVHTGIYRDDFLSEPAVAAILAGELGINADRPHANGKKTLAFDLTDSGRGTLTALGVVANLMRSGSISRLW